MGPSLSQSPACGVPQGLIPGPSHFESSELVACLSRGVTLTDVKDSEKTPGGESGSQETTSSHGSHVRLTPTLRGEFIATKVFAQCEFLNS